MIPRFRLAPFEFFVHPTRTRFPFRYGIASMTDVPHLFVRTRVETDRCASIGLASEGLPPKWFTKDPATTFDQDLEDMHAVIRHAASIAQDLAAKPVTLFQLWLELNRQQHAWAIERGFPPLLAALGISLCERAVLDGLCRAFELPVHRLILTSQLGIRLGEIYPELGDLEPGDLLPHSPLERLDVRHTVGLADPLTSGDIPAGELVADGLPHDLESNVRAYGLRYFKIKLSGQADHDLQRLQAITAILGPRTREPWFVTLDGNENFHHFSEFREFWSKLEHDTRFDGLREGLLVVEQPVHRNHALADETGQVLRNWPEHPPFIIDESDGAVGDVPRALDLGYAGTSHKNCKGIIKGIANACLLEHRRRQGRAMLLTGEDLANLGPVALLQDLACMALLGIGHVERNGHHYYRGLDMWPASWQQVILDLHPELYQRHPLGFAHLRIHEGQLSLGSVNAAPFGLKPLLNPSALQSIKPGLPLDANPVPC